MTDAPLTPEQVSLVQDSWKQVAGIADTAADLFYSKLFEMDPALRPLFPEDMSEQKKKLMQMIGAAVGGLTNLEQLVPVVQDLGRRHVGYGVKDEHYATVGGALVWTLGQGLGDAFTPATEAAWVATYGVLADTMKAAAAEVN